MKKKWLKIPLIIIISLVVVLMGANVCGILKVTRAGSSASLPTIKFGQRLIISSLSKPERFRFIAFRYTDTLMQQRGLYVHRLCGMPGDTVQIKGGVLFVNGVNADEHLNLCNEYLIPDTASSNVTKLFSLEDLQAPILLTNGTAAVILTRDQVKQLATLNIPCTPDITPAKDSNIYLYPGFPPSWNNDHFGPVVVPGNKYFVLGDNRHRAQDSRYIGFISKDSVAGVVLGIR